MTQFSFKNLPKGFEFPLTRREVRDFLKTTSANFEIVRFGGLASSESFYSKNRVNNLHFVCSIRAKYKESLWNFEWEIEGLRPERYANRREEIAQALLSQIRKWTDEKSLLPETAPKKSCRASVHFDLTKTPEHIAELSEWNSMWD